MEVTGDTVIMGSGVMATVLVVNTIDVILVAGKCLVEVFVGRGGPQGRSVALMVTHWSDHPETEIGV